MAQLDSCLIVSSAKGQRSLAQLLSQHFAAAKLTAAASGNEARRILLNQDFELIIINAPLPDETGQDLAMTAAHQSSASVLLLIRGDAMNTVQPNLSDFGVIVLEKPLNRLTFEQALSLVQVTNQRLDTLRAENRRLERKLDELRLVSRAKCLLIERQGLTEAAAHAYIERMAMDRRDTKQSIAEEIIKQYQDI